MKSVRKNQFKSFEISGGGGIISDYEFLLSILNAFTLALKSVTQGVTM